MDGITLMMLMGGVLCVILYQDMRADEKLEASRARVAELIDERNDLNDELGDLEDECSALRDEMREMEDAEIEIDIDLELEDDDDDAY